MRIGVWKAGQRQLSLAPLGANQTCEAGHGECGAQVAPASHLRALPEGRELHLLVVAGDQLWDEGEMGDLCGRPPKLKDDHERDEVNEGCPLGRVLRAAETGAEDEGERENHADGPCTGKKKQMREKAF